MRWIKLNVTDARLRDDKAGFVPVLFFATTAIFERGVCAGRFYYKRNGSYFVSLQGSRFRSLDVSHWMPMPEPPRTE